MKVVIELDDAVLRNAVQAQIGAEIARISAPMLEKVAQDVIQRKLERFNPMALAERDLRQEILDVIKLELERYLGAQYERRARIEALAKSVLRDILKDQ